MSGRSYGAPGSVAARVWDSELTARYPWGRTGINSAGRGQRSPKRPAGARRAVAEKVGEKDDTQPVLKLSRRLFLGGGAAATATLASQTLGAHAAWADEGRQSCDPGEVGYGHLHRRRASNTGEELLALPAGFSYVVFGRTGTPMTDGAVTPIAHDGMGAFAGPDGTVRLIRNHEVRTTPGSATGRVYAGGDSTRYDALGVGGCTILDVDPKTGDVAQSFVGINGTIVNCAGGVMLDDAGWITCEETTAGPRNGWAQKHGYIYELPVDAASPGSPYPSVPIRAAGRFSHEAVSIDPATGFVYETEDQSGTTSGFFRYRPSDPTTLSAGGVLEMLKIRGATNYDTRQGQTMGSRLPVEWVVIDTPDPDLENGAATVTSQGLAKGAARFNRLEGCWYGNGSIWFNSTSGGDVKNGDNPGGDGFFEGYGQVWRYIPAATGGALELVYESPGRKVLDSPDNLTFTPRGGIILCEDDASSVDVDTHPLAPGLINVNRLIGLDPGGQPFEFAVNIADTSEFAGACFSPDGRYMFVNTLGSTTLLEPPGRTYAITGPWQRGPL